MKLVSYVCTRLDCFFFVSFNVVFFCLIITKGCEGQKKCYSCAEVCDNPTPRDCVGEQDTCFSLTQTLENGKEVRYKGCDTKARIGIVDTCDNYDVTPCEGDLCN